LDKAALQKMLGGGSSIKMPGATPMNTQMDDE